MPADAAEVASVSRVATVVLMIVAMRHVFLALEGPDPRTVGYLSIRKVPPRQGGDGGLGRAHPPGPPGAAVWHDGVMRAPRLPVLVALSALAVLTGCSRAVVGTPPVVSTPPEPPALGIEEVGLASWYGSPHHGRRTASGELYDMNQMTAAHKTLPFGTRLLVTNRDTRRTAEVRINDRGPFVKGRILDVSYAAARQLGVATEGVFPVRLRVISLPAGKVEAPAAEGGLTVEDGSFTDRTKAEAQRREVGGVATVSEVTVADQSVYRVDLGSYSTPMQARTAAQPLAARRFPLLVAAR